MVLALAMLLPTTFIQVWLVSSPVNPVNKELASDIANPPENSRTSV